MKSVTLKIKQLLKEKNISIIDFALKLGRTRQNIYDILNEKQKINIETIKQISEILNVSVAYFFDENIENHNNVDSESLKKENNILKEEIESLKREVNFLKHTLDIKDLLINQMLELNKIQRQESESNFNAKKIA